MNVIKDLFHLIWPAIVLLFLHYVLFGAPGFFMSLILVGGGVVLSMFVPQLTEKLKSLFKKAYVKVRDLLNL